ncbi:MAG: HAD-IC family P-type ATPase [Dehalococcoidia bacterium]
MTTAETAGSGLQLFGQSFQGLTESEVEERRARGEVNQAPSETSRTYTRIIIDNALPPVNIALFGISIVLLALGLVGDALLTAGLVIGNVVVGVFQESRAKRQLDQIALLVRPKATVIRNGEERDVVPDEIVKDDLLLLRPGDQIQTDGEVLGAEGFSVDEAMLTGESDVVAKHTGDEVFSATFAMTGSAVYRTTSVGQGRVAQGITAQARAFRNVRTPLQREVSWLIIGMGILMLLLGIEVLNSLHRLYGGIPLVEGARAAAVIVALVPQGLWFMITVTYSIAIVKVARTGALIQRMNAIESISHVDILCFDKTGTLTTNSLQLEHLLPLDEDEEGCKKALGRFAASASFSNKTNDALKAAFPGEVVDAKAEVTFDSSRKWSGLLFDNDGGLYVLGAPEILQDYVEMAADAPDTTEWTSQGLRVLLFARKQDAKEVGGTAQKPELPHGLEPLCYIVLRDELRENVADIIRQFGESGISLKVISGDNPETVAALAKQAGLPDADKTMSGAELRELSDEELAERVEETAVFGRVTPSDKERLVRALQKKKHYVAMTGDGVNDVPALKASQVAIAMGAGSSVTRSVADLLLLDNAFSVLPSAFSEGQRIRKGMEAIIRVFLIRTFAVALIVFGAALLTREFPVTPRHTAIWATLTVGLPSLAIATWAHAGATKRYILTSAIPFVAPAAITIGIMGLGVYELVLKLEDVEAARTALTAAAVMAGAVLIPFAQDPPRDWMTNNGLFNDKRPIVMSGLMILFFWVSVIVEPLRDFYELDSLSIVPIFVVFAGFFLWLAIIRAWWRTTAGLSERLIKPDEH